MDAVRTTLSSLGLDRLAESRLSAGSEADAASGSRADEVASFGEQLAETVSETDRLITAAETKAAELSRGEGDSVETIIAVSKADLALRHVVTLRNRALEAYQEIMRMPV